LIDACAQFGLETRRVDGRSGVWTLDGQRKVAAIGVRVTRGVAMHGFALNCNPDLAAFGAIVPCGIADAGVSSLSAELGKTVTVADALDVVESSVVSTLTRTAMSPP
jgi:lipoyl(octanoyl) transferase